MNEMLVVVENLVFNWSRSRDPEKEHAKPFSTEPTIKLKDWTEAYQWVQESQKNLIRNGNFYYTSNEVNATKAAIKVCFI